MLLFYVRHGDPIYNPDGLTELGKKQADALVDRMKCCKPDRIFASSSNRAIMTAQPTARALEKEIETLDWCHENYAGRDFMLPDVNGKKKWCFQQQKMKEIFVSEEVRRLDKEWYLHPAFNDTNFQDGILRIQKCADEFISSLGYRHVPEKNGYIAERPNEERIALFAHQGFGLAFLSCLLDIPYPQFCTHFDLGRSDMTVIKFKGDGFVIPKVLQLSNDSHKFAAGLEMSYSPGVEF